MITFVDEPYPYCRSILNGIEPYYIGADNDRRVLLLLIDQYDNPYFQYFKCAKCSKNAVASLVYEDRKMLGYKELFANYNLNSDGNNVCFNCNVVLTTEDGLWTFESDASPCEHCNGSGIGWNHLAGKEVVGGCSRCNGIGVV